MSSRLIIMEGALKILITTEFYLPLRCGVTVAVLNLRKALERMGHEVRILTIGANRESYFSDGVYYMKSNLPKLYKDSYATLSFGGELFDEIIDWKPDIVHSQCEFFTMVYAKKVARKLHIPIVHTCHTDFDAYGIHFTKNEKLWHYLTHKYIPKLLKSVKFIICPTEKVHSLLLEYGVENPMTIIPTGLDLENFSRNLTDDEYEALRKEMGFSMDDFILISVCRLSEEKNVSEAISVFADLHRERPETKMLIVGDGSMRETLEQQVVDMKLSGTVHFTGSVPLEEVWKYYHISDLFISSSLSETQGLTYFEALASSIPIICKPDDALRFFLKPGYNGYFFSDSTSFCNEVRKLLSDKSKYEQIRCNAVESVADYSLDIYGERIFSIYKSVMMSYHE